MSFKPIGAGLAGLLADWVADPSAKEAILCGTWPRAVGEVVARRTVAEEFDDGVLTVRVVDSTWAGVLQEMSGELVDKMNAALGRRWVRTIAWR